MQDLNTDPFFLSFYAGFFIGVAISLGCLWLSALSRETD
jgi:hypothetical protein